MGGRSELLLDDAGGGEAPVADALSRGISNCGETRSKIFRCGVRNDRSILLRCLQGSCCICVWLERLCFVRLPLSFYDPRRSCRGHLKIENPPISPRPVVSREEH